MSMKRLSHTELDVVLLEWFNQKSWKVAASNKCETGFQYVTDADIGRTDKTLKFKLCDIHARMGGNMTAMPWKDKQDVCIMMNMHRPPANSSASNAKSAHAYFHVLYHTKVNLPIRLPSQQGNNFKKCKRCTIIKVFQECTNFFRKDG